jgi:hypothetical protein
MITKIIGHDEKSPNHPLNTIFYVSDENTIIILNNNSDLNGQTSFLLNYYSCILNISDGFDINDLLLFCLLS